jgi:hypothetical protein
MAAFLSGERSDDQPANVHCRRQRRRIYRPIGWSRADTAVTAAPPANVPIKREQCAGAARGFNPSPAEAWSREPIRA